MWSLPEKTLRTWSWVSLAFRCVSVPMVLFVALALYPVSLCLSGFRGRLVESFFSAGLVVPHGSAFHQVFLSLLRGRHRLRDPGRHCPSDIEEDSAPHVTVFCCFVCLMERNIHGGFFWSTSCSCQWTWSVCALRVLSLIFGEDDADSGEEVHLDAPCSLFARLER